MPLIFPNLSITEQAIDSSIAQTSKISEIVMVVTRTSPGTAANNTAVRVASLSEMTTKIGTVPAVSLAAFEAMRAIAPQAAIWVVAGFSSLATPTQAQHLMAGLNALTRGAMEVKLAVVVAPEVYALSVAAERASAFGVAEAAVATNGFDWMYFHNFGTEIQTKAAADTVRAGMLSGQGNSSHYFGWTKDSSNRDVPIAAIAAAYLVALNQGNDGFFSPAANGTIIPGAIPAAYQLSLDDARLITQDRSFNFPWMATAGQYQIWGDHTASSDPSWNFINTRLAASTIQSWISEVLADQIYKPVDQIDSSGEGMRSRELAGRVTQVMERARAEGALSVPPTLPDGTVPPPYRLITTPITGGRAQLEVRFCPIRSLREISINLSLTSRP